jgi:hypothetical protein
MAGDVPRYTGPLLAYDHKANSKIMITVGRSSAPVHLRQLVLLFFNGFARPNVLAPRICFRLGDQAPIKR